MPRCFASLLLAFCSLSIFAAAPALNANGTIVCEVTAVGSTYLYCGHDRISVTFHQIWLPVDFKAPVGESQTSLQRKQRLTQWLLHKKISIWILSSHERKNETAIVGTVSMDGKDIGLELIQAGLAVTHPSTQWDENTEYIAAQKLAQEQKAGLWGDPVLAKGWARTKDVTQKEMIDQKRSDRRYLLFLLLLAAPVLLVIKNRISMLLHSVRTRFKTD
ncbi:MAG: thermonuclease family protein [Burkholderiaceae bacterium]|nr:thermonuclease family protein [Burkholderiaceae bacterium]